MPIGLTQSDWDSLKLNDLRDTVSGLDYNHPIRNFVEQRLLSPVETKLAGSKTNYQRPIQSIPKIPRSDNFPEEFVYVGGSENSFSEDPVTSELQYCLFTCPGAIFESEGILLPLNPFF